MGMLYEMVESFRKFCANIKDEYKELVENYRDRKSRFINKWNDLCDKAEEHTAYKRIGLFSIALFGIITSLGVSAVIFILILGHPILMLFYVYISICALMVLIWNNKRGE